MLQTIKEIFKNIYFIYKNIFHWGGSKILISLSSYLVGILLALPFFIISLIVIYISPLQLNSFFAGELYLMQEATNNLISFLIVILLFTFSIILLGAGISYKRLLFAKLNFKYLKKKKLKLKKNNYFNVNLIIKSVQISLIILGYMISITLFFIAIFTIIIFLFGGINEVNLLIVSNQINPFSIISLILFILYILILIYLLYRTYFSYFILLENEEYTGMQAIKESIKKTKKIAKFLKLSLFIIIFFIILFPINYIGGYIDFKDKNINNFIKLRNITIEAQSESVLDQNDFYDYSILKSEFGELTNEELTTEVNKYYIYMIIFFLLNYIFIFGILDMIIASFYKKEIK